MKNVVDKTGAPIKGLFRKDDGSLAVVDHAGQKRSSVQKKVINDMHAEITDLKQQLKLILDKLNG